MYKAFVHVTVKDARVDPATFHVTWVEHGPLNQTVGPEEAVYCRLQNPRGDLEFDGFGRCQVAVDRVLRDLHQGDWSMLVALPGRAETEEDLFVVKVKVAANPEVYTNVLSDKPTVRLSCSVTSSQQKTGCIFRNPAGKVIVANPGVSEGRYLFDVSQTSVDSYSHYSCNLQITDPVTADLGLWRCDLEAEQEKYYGFLTVLCPWAMEDPVIVESVETEPVLKPQAETVVSEENRPTTLACTAWAPLRYCYFRAPNGTVFNVSPGKSSPAMEYAGASFAAGECGVRFHSLSPSANGHWSCHVGVGDVELSHSITVYVQEEFSVWSIRQGENLVIRGSVAGDRPLEYCRFVRFDGHGFMSHSPPYPYVDQSVLSSGLCRLKVPPSKPDLEPWTVVAKLLGSDDEVSRQTDRVEWQKYPDYESESYTSLYIWLSILVIVMVCLGMAGVVAAIKNRHWISKRTSELHTSMRNSLRKTPPTDANATNPVA